jgi:hypothetical protein
MMRELRRLERFDLELCSKLLIREGDEDEPRVIDLTTENVSAGGAFFATDKPLSAGTEVRMELVIPLDRLKKVNTKKACIMIRGKVLRAGSGGIAVTFGNRYKIVPVEEE